MADVVHGPQSAVDFAEKQIAFYATQSSHNYRTWIACTAITIVGSALGTIASTITVEGIWYYKALLGVPAAAAGIAASFNAIFKYRSESMRQTATSEAISVQLTKFQSGATPYAEAAKGGPGATGAVTRFIDMIERIVAGEIAAWRSEK